MQRACQIEAKVLSEQIRGKQQSLIIRTICDQKLYFSLIASTPLLSDYRLMHTDLLELEKPSILFRVQMSEIFLHELDAKNLREQGLCIRGKNVMRMLIEIANELQIPIKLCDRSDVKYSLFAKTGKTYYERFGFKYERSIPESIRLMHECPGVKELIMEKEDSKCLTDEGMKTVMRYALGSDESFSTIERILSGRMIYKPSIIM